MTERLVSSSVSATDRRPVWRLTVIRTHAVCLAVLQMTHGAVSALVTSAVIPWCGRCWGIYTQWRIRTSLSLVSVGRPIGGTGARNTASFHQDRTQDRASWWIKKGRGESNRRPFLASVSPSLNALTLRQAGHSLYKPIFPLLADRVCRQA